MSDKPKYNPRLNINMVRKVKQLRKKMVLIHGQKVPMPFRHIAKKLGVNVKQVYLWYKYDID